MLVGEHHRLQKAQANDRPPHADHGGPRAEGQLHSFTTHCRADCYADQADAHGDKGDQAL
jgi:hypothetical protein